MIFENYKELAITPLRKKALDILAAGIKSVLPKKVLSEKLPGGVMGDYHYQSCMEKGWLN